jgi:hypothetical protein
MPVLSDCIGLIDELLANNYKLEQEAIDPREAIKSMGLKSSHRPSAATPVNIVGSASGEAQSEDNDFN